MGNLCCCSGRSSDNDECEYDYNGQVYRTKKLTHHFINDKMKENNWSDRDHAVMKGARVEVTKTPGYVQKNCCVQVYGDDLNTKFVSGKGRNRLVVQRDENDSVNRHWEKREFRFAAQQDMKTYMPALLNAGGKALAIGMKAS